jgi:adenosylcobinamide-phosphate synthase
MSFFAVLLALFIEQLRPLPRRNAVLRALVAWTGWTGRNFDAGHEQHAWVVWAMTVLAPAAAVFAVHVVVAQFSLLLALAWDVAVLYLTLGFRHFSHFFTDIREALERGDETEARRLLAEWRHVDTSELPHTELLRHVIEHSLLAAHRHVFGVFFWFVLLSALGFGPAGAVLYRLAEFASRYWAFRSQTLGVPVNERLMQRSQALYAAIDHAPARLTAFGFAVVGNFEEAIDCWRRDARLWLKPNEGVILAAASGAVGVSLGGGAPPPLAVDQTKGLSAGTTPTDAEATGSTPGLQPEVGHLRSVVGLVWRSVVLWMLLLALLTLANLVG